MAIDKNSKSYIAGFEEGQEAVRQKPHYAPSNPYDDRGEPEKFEGWDDGAYSAGITEIYTNGVLHRSERR